MFAAFSNVVAKFTPSSDNTPNFRALQNGSASHHASSSLITKARSGSEAISAAGSLIISILSSVCAEEGGVTALEEVCPAMQAMFAGGIQQPIEALAGDLWEEAIEPYLSEEDRTAIRRILSDCLDIRHDIRETLAKLSDPSSPSTNPSDFDESTSSLKKDTAASVEMSVISTISSRYITSLHTLFVTLFYLSESPDITEEDEEAEEFIQMINKAFVLYYRYSVLSLLVAQSGDEIALVNGVRRNAGIDDNEDPSSSLIQYLLESYRASTTSQSDASELFLSSSGLIHDDLSEVDPTTEDVKFAHSILAAGHSLLAGRIADLYPLSAGMAYIQGRAALEAVIVGEAVRSFEQAAAGGRDASISHILPDCTSLPSFYQHVAQLFADKFHHGPVVHFGQLALASSPKDQPTPKSLWTIILLAGISMGEYEDAYALLVKTPYMDLQRDFLAQLISVMCESNEAGRLNELGFIGLQKEVEGILSYKARNSDPLRHPNYSKVLYSWYISRGDYRSAGDIMYQQGRRFGDSATTKMSAFDLAAMQARSYLAAINALKLIDKRNAWISLSGLPPKAIRGSKRKRTSSYIPEDEFSQDKRPISIITLEDIEVEYSLVLARLRLSSHIQDLHEHGITVSPEEVVGLLVERSMFDLALSAASTMNVDMTNIFTTIASKCVELSRVSDQRGDTISAAWLHTSPLTSRLRGSPSALAQRYLQTTLNQHDSVKTHFAYRVAVANTFFEMNADKSTGWQMPAWLVEGEMERDPEGWISRALRYGWVEEAVDWAAEVIRRAVPPELLSKKPDTANIPYNLIDRVLAAAGEGDEKDDEKVKRKVKALREAVERRTAGLKKLEGR